MASGDIVLINSKWGSTWFETFLSNSIKWFTKSKYSHSLVTMPKLLDCDMCIEASANGVTMQRFDTAYANNPSQECDIYELLDTPQNVKDAACKSLLASLDTTYGFLEYPWFIWRRLNSLLGRDIKKQDNWSQQGEICSWVCVQYLTACGLSHLFKDYGKCSVAPQDLRNIFDAHPELFRKI